MYPATSAGRSDSPNPRRSGATTRYPAVASASIWYRHTSHESGNPCSSRTGGPSPAVATLSRTSPVSTGRWMISTVMPGIMPA